MPAEEPRTDKSKIHSSPLTFTGLSKKKFNSTESIEIEAVVRMGALLLNLLTKAIDLSSMLLI